MAAGFVNFFFLVLNWSLDLVVIAIIANAILSWLLAFDVINYRNRFVYQIATGLDRFTSPLLAPLRRFIPSLGGIDITPIILLLVIRALQSTVIVALHNLCLGMVGY
ncbi:YggT family protein [uncultured Brevundimonas sp.]|uniref:YggT family protein n=1 Tax=uncultured Brevundimonas sp. TaxID=213418 RepID=UPI00261E556B|nr:YggT family protein [uncultured Brevundimonas sp.]